MRRAFLFLIWLPLSAFAWNYSETMNSTSHSAQMRFGADVHWRWKSGFGMSLDEDLRIDMLNSTTLETTAGKTTTLSGPDFNKSYTTLAFSYKHPRFTWLKADAGYTLKLVKKDTTAVEKIMKHRVFFGLTGSFNYENWSFSLRERAMTEIRMGDIDLHTATGCYEHNRAEWYLRSKIEVAYHAFSKPLKPYIWCELVNTLNANKLQQYYAGNNLVNSGRQYIRRIRSSIGLVWKLTRRSSLDFYYRFNYGYDRDVNVKAKSQKIILTEERSFQHAIGIVYSFNASPGR